MGKKIIAYDLGTSSVKAALYESDGAPVMDVDNSYNTYFPQIGWHEQRPLDWWDTIIKCTHQLMNLSGADPESIECMALSSHSMGVVPVDDRGALLRDKTPIWSDMRAREQTRRFFEKISLNDWYMKSGSSIPGSYAVFKIMWYMDNEPDMIKKTYKILGTKDFINLKLTGRFLTDNSYASGSGVYDLKTNNYSPELIKISGIDERLLPDIVPSTHVVGELTGESAQALGLPKKIKVICGGVDNSCMALGAKGIKEGRVYTNIGSSAWIAITSSRPILDTKCYPNIFAHVIPGMYNSGVTIFSSGSAFRWVRDVVCSDLVKSGAATGTTTGGAQSDATAGMNPYDLMTELAARSPVGANKLIFYPTMAMASPLDSSVNTRGAFTGLDLKHTREDVIRATLEGVTMSLGWYLDELRRSYAFTDQMLLVGGGSNSSFWRQLFADIYNMDIIKTNIGQSAGALGAAALAAVGAGLWSSFDVIDQLHEIVDITKPIPENHAKYEKLMNIFKFTAGCQAAIGDKLQELQL